MKIGISGTFGIGKTEIASELVTACRTIKNLSIEFIVDTARTCPEHIRRNSLKAQMWIMYCQITREIDAEHKPLGRGDDKKLIVCDTTVLDNYAYALYWSQHAYPQNNKLKGMALLKNTMLYWITTYDHIFYIKSNTSCLLSNIGFESALSLYQESIDIIIRQTIEKYDLKNVYIFNDCTNIVSTILNKIMPEQVV
jgi:hypothetical protein